jgi:hypothetical protein
MADERDAEQFRKNRRNRNLALLAVLAGLVVLFYLLTVVKFSGMLGGGS